MYSDSYCGTYKINSLAPKRLLKTQVFGAKGKLYSEEKILTSFSSYFRASKSKCPKGIPAYTLEVFGSFFGRKRSIETNISKKSFYHRDNRFRPIFRGIIECEKPQETIYMDPQSTLTLTVEVV